MAAVLAAGEGAVLSHTSAGELWGILRPMGGRGLAKKGGAGDASLRQRGSGGRRRSAGLRRSASGSAPRQVEVTVPAGSGRERREGLLLHRSTTLSDDETTRRDGIPVTTPARTILDLATVLDRRPLERAVDQAERLGLCRPRQLEAIAARHKGRAGAGALEELLRSHRIGSTVTRSELEERFLELCRRCDLPQPEVNTSLLDYVVDFLWRDARLVVEVDGQASHGTRRAFQADRDRDSRLAAHGYRTLRFTWWDVTRRPAVVAHRVRRVLSAG